MKLIIGCGYLGSRVAREWLAQGESVSALTRSPERARHLAACQITPIVGDVTRPESLKFPDAHTVLVAVGYDRRTPSASLTETYVDGLANVLAALSRARRLIYISSTGVYAQTDGEWVDETSECAPNREGGKACWQAERLLSESDWGDQSVILRLAGIYGPDRIPAREEALSRLDLNLHGYLNLIHVEDAVQAVLAAEQYQWPPATFLVSDGHPVARSEYYREVVQQFPGSSSKTDVDSARRAERSARPSRHTSSKRVSNRRMIETLGVHLRYPSYRAGLAAIAAGC